MVFFTCSQCGQAVKKNQVETHCKFQCRGCESLSCIDCGKLFWGDDYKDHTKCISEDQKYGGKNFQPKPSSNKGEIKQEKWIEHIKNTIATKNLSGPLSSILTNMIEYSNIPRKKSKFENFLQNSLKIRNPKLINSAWDIFSEGESKNPSSAPTPSNEMNGNLKRPSNPEEEMSSKKTCLNGSLLTNGHSTSFNWTEVIQKMLTNAESAVPISQLRKMVLAEYVAAVKDSTLTKDELKKKFKHYLSNSELFSLNKI